MDTASSSGADDAVGPGGWETIARGLIFWTSVLAFCTLVLWKFREHLHEAHTTLAFLLIIVGASARNGRVVGLTLAVLAFLAFNFFLLPTYYTLAIEDPFDAWLLVGFLTTGAVTAQLFHRAQRLAVEAQRVGALRESDRLKDALLASVSHDLRTPLTTIRALAAELRADDERAVIIEEEAERLNRLVADLLDLSRLRAGAMPLDLQIVAAEDLIGATLQRLASVRGIENVRVHLPADGSLPLGRMDFVQALRALGNLLENALLHGRDSPVELEVETEGSDLVFRILDRGPGIPESDRLRIFEPFSRGERTARVGDGGGAATAAASRAGTGLGLAITRSVAVAHAGSVRHSARPGGGSVFELRLPAASLPPLDAPSL